ncbi:transcription factor HBP-1b(c38)-like [Olea europaea subsp. europaea]|uniref:Transcription factor HBP-1b(C38)-like n=1 Tax=Olea europaea subsp. europaea TaxID=158383 RepID=A0A8S0QX63_OLEEU|nr:transcription factor HBP-1b(c38)-like [Olea europaea subsp. europaea]
MAPSFGGTGNYGGSFEVFLERWFARQQNLLEELLRTEETYHESHDQDGIRELIDRVIAHYQEYLLENSRMANRCTFLVFSPTWLSPLEKALLWIAGFKPGSALHLVTSSVSDLSENQRQRIERLKHETKMEEKLLADELSSIHESVAAPPLAEVAKEEGRRQLMEGEIRETPDSELETLRSAVQSLLIRADLLRARTVQVVVETLSPLQNVRFFAAVIQFQIRIRMLGRQRDSEQPRHEVNGW